MASGALLLIVALVSTAVGAEIPFELEGRVIFVKGTINDRGPYTLILDTGATETILTPPTARALGIKAVPAGGHQAIAVAQSIAVGGVSVRNFPVFVFDPPEALSLRLDHGMNYHGILGHSFLSQFVVTIDYRHKTVRLTKP